LSKLIESRAEFQDMAERRLAESKALLDLGLWDGAYYLAGYAVELGLKACIIKMLLETDAFPDREYSRGCYTHDLEKLVWLARLAEARNDAANADPLFRVYWGMARAWSEELRYHRIEESEARLLYAAISDDTHGVLPWIRTRW
jgi:hypothetical protein